MGIKNTIPIVFNSGAYGTYLEWVFHTLTTDVDIVSPFNASGNSHKFKGNHLANIEGWDKYIESTDEFLFVRFHPKTHGTQKVTFNLEKVLSQVDRAIHLYPDQDTILLNLNNQCGKLLNDEAAIDPWWDLRMADDNFSENLYKAWSINEGEKIPLWVKRELLSFNIMPSWYDQVDWYHPDKWQHPNCIVITISELLYKFEETLTRLQKFCNLDFKKDIKELIPYHEEMLTLQHFIDQDRICKQVVQSTIAGDDFTWNDLPIVSQSWVQWELRNQGYEIECFGLDKFPTNSLQLKKLLYPI